MPHWKTIVLAAIPTAFIVRMVAIYAIYLKEEKDEFQRELFIKSLLWGTGAILSITTFWTFLNIFAHVRPFQAFDVLLIFSIAFAIATITQNLYHRGGSGE
jgi:RsiW-degrading membrane proteinase PrsW (M82 family)